VSSSTTIRAYDPADEPAVADLWGRIFAHDPPRNEPRAVIARKLRVQPDLFLVAEDAGRLLGTAVAGFDGVRGWVHHLAVEPGARRRGLGRRLMGEAERRLAALGCVKLNLQVRAGNEAALRFYQRLGYGVEERVSLGKEIA
jgi:ribosomal protein S18 acetylase RimI-like enzyme